MPLLQKFLYSRQEAAEVLSLSLRTIDYLIANGELVSRRIGRRVLIESAILEQFAQGDHTTGVEKS